MLITEDNVEMVIGMKVFYIDFLMPGPELKESSIEEIREDDEIPVVLEDGRLAWADEEFPIIFAIKKNAEKHFKDNVIM